MQIFLRTITGKQVAFEVEPNELVSTLQARIHEKEDIPIESQTLVFGGKELNKNLTLKENGLTPDCIVCLVVRMRGGSR
jgi:hypothetical protein